MPSESKTQTVEVGGALMERAFASLDRSAGIFEDITAEAWRRGSALAIELIRESDMNEMALRADWRDGRGQDNRLYRYLQRIREKADGEQVEIAFCSVLSHFIAGSLDSTYTPEGLQEIVGESGPVPQAVRP